METVKKLFYYVILMINTACGTHFKAALAPMQWVDTEYQTCSPNITEPQPLDLMLSVYRTDLPFGRYDELNSIRSFLVKTDGSSKDLSTPLITKMDQTISQVQTWSQDGKHIFLNAIWEKPEHAMYEQLKEELTFDSQNYHAEPYRYNLDTDSYDDLNGGSPVSYYTTGTIEIPALGKYIIQAMLGGTSTPFIMNQDGSGKQLLSGNSGFTYGINVSPDSNYYTFHVDYKVVIGNLTTHDEVRVEPCNFNFRPTFNPTSDKVAFFCGDSNVSPDIYVVNKDGSNAHKVATRNSYSGSVLLFDNYDFHGGGSDNIYWVDSENLIYAANKDGSVELFKINVTTLEKTQLTHTFQGSLNVFPRVSSDGKWLIFMSTRHGLRDTYKMDLSTLETTQVTHLDLGCGSLSAAWRPN